MRNLAQDALVYPGARLDGSPVRECQGVIHSFIFLDYGTPKAEVMAELTRQRRSGTGFAHHRLVGVVEFDPTSIVTGADPAFIRDTSFNQGMSEAELEEELQEQLSKVANSLIFLSHAPPYGSRDLTLRGYHIGHRPLFRYLHDRDWPHSLIFCGHVHQSFGFEEVGATTILNVATGYALVEWNEIETSVIEMARLVDSPSFWDSP